ncbi:MerR family transcriptional regulator [Ancylobacter mangrovi]|uniref:MerR family transcriptional regulator n=1 Tax=Ancylobacter mangrovi TaxID=2972472 RepID=UPI00216214BF|nr:MerR family transcriptional regulator [Ancylobacter mangrovi]MCS0503526.1 MerR family transcriptional regulator [Ancylobacter mangrovi]
MEKGPDAFRTISEVAEDLDLPQHVLRFWETRFPQIRPLKRGGGRRYYRPDDVELLRGIRHLLYAEGYTIRGVQRILKEEGPRYVQAIWRDVETEVLEGAALEAAEARRRERPEPGVGPIDAGHPGRDQDDDETHGGGLGGFLNLLPSRHRESPDEPAARRPARRRDPEDDDQDYLELPLLPDLAPQNRPAREPSERARDERAAGEALPNFPFRAVAPEAEPGPAFDEDFEDAPVPPGDEDLEADAVPTHALRAPPLAVPPLDLSSDEIQNLKAALHELQECRRLLDAARARKG